MKKREQTIFLSASPTNAKRNRHFWEQMYPRILFENRTYEILFHLEATIMNIKKLSHRTARNDRENFNSPGKHRQNCELI